MAASTCIESSACESVVKRCTTGSRTLHAYQAALSSAHYRSRPRRRLAHDLAARQTASDLASVRRTTGDDQPPGVLPRKDSVLGVSDQTVARRYRRLRSSGDLRVLGMADESRLGRTAWVVRLHCTPDAAEKLAQAFARRPDTSYVALISGARK